MHRGYPALPLGVVDSAASTPRPPGTEEPRRFLPQLRYELLGCAWSGHELLGTDVVELRPQDAAVVRDNGGLRWHRCLRCDSWLPLPVPDAPTRRHLPDPDELELPLRGRPLRDKVVLRVIAVDRGVHFVVLGLIAVVVFVVAANQETLHRDFSRILADLQGGLGGPATTPQHGVLGAVSRLFALSSSRLYETAGVFLGYAVLEGVEAVGLWYAKRWAEYLTFVATVLLLPLEVYELTHRTTALKIVALLVNLAIAVYLVYAKRLFGVRGGVAAERAEREHDSGWSAILRATPEPHLRSAAVPGG
jgi:uncharacterized membrane protein (DUF2068 family)